MYVLTKALKYNFEDLDISGNYYMYVQFIIETVKISFVQKLLIGPR